MHIFFISISILKKFRTRIDMGFSGGDRKYRNKIFRVFKIVSYFSIYIVDSNVLVYSFVFNTNHFDLLKNRLLNCCFKTKIDWMKKESH